MSFSNPLTGAVTSGDENAVSALLADGADVNERTNGGQTPLILAIIFGHTNLVRLLVNAGADPEHRDNLGLNAIDWAQRRGLNEALEILTDKPQSAKLQSSTPPKRIVINLEEPEKSVPEPPPPAAREAEPRETVSDVEKSKRWIAGLKQRLDEQSMRRMNRNEPALSIPTIEEPEPFESEPTEPEVIETKWVEPEPPPRAVHSTRILTPPPDDDDEPPPLVSKAPRPNPPLFWIMVVVTLFGSIVLGSLITAYLYKSNQAAARAADQITIQKGMPEIGGELAGMETSIPEAECPVKGSKPVSGIVTVFVLVDKKGQVYKARGVGGDWLMRGAATEAAMKSTFSPEKLAGRETEGTITYTFK